MAFHAGRVWDARGLGGWISPQEIQVRGKGLKILWEKARDRKGKVKNHPAAIGGLAAVVDDTSGNRPLIHPSMVAILWERLLISDWIFQRNTRIATSKAGVMYWSIMAP